MPHPFHVLCEKGGKPRNPLYRNSGNALEVRFGAAEAVRGVSLGLEEGEVMEISPRRLKSALKT